MYTVKVKLSCPNEELLLEGEWVKWSNLQNDHELHFGCHSITAEARQSLQNMCEEGQHLFAVATINQKTEIVSISGELEAVTLFENSNLPLVQCQGKTGFKITRNTVRNKWLSGEAGNSYPRLFMELHWKNSGGQDRRLGVPPNAVEVIKTKNEDLEITCYLPVLEPDIDRAIAVIKQQLNADRAATEVFITNEEDHRTSYSSRDFIVQYDILEKCHVIKFLGKFETAERWSNDLIKVDEKPYSTV